MKQNLKEPLVKVVRFESMDVITTSGEEAAKSRGVTIQQLTTADDNKSYGFSID